MGLIPITSRWYLDHPVKPLTMGWSDPYHFMLVSRPPSETPDHGWVSDNLITSRWYLDHPVKPLTMGGSDPYHFMLVSRPPSETPDHGWV